MRNEQEMMNLILNTAKDNERIRAVYMNGSRTNSNVPKDIFQDYVIVYVVTETASFIQDKSWVHAFGEILMMQEPDKNDVNREMNVDFTKSYVFLMLFIDGNRINLTLETKEMTLDRYGEDMLTLPIVDKDNLLPSIPSTTDLDYHVDKPTKEEYDHFTNDFWWCSQNVAKGI
ncbi:hypothetical protein GCM10007111_03660 [Virgibacillus kapii]|uniref:Aminoglycoside adenylyltransferase n=1 Tax=Virgibacillus kapii TaxID=1638645 RepID=A0ABQ2D3S5_9BACI|nr:hypothetical protein GCM10007111_03660 [Virgibacillus kapii]